MRSAIAHAVIASGLVLSAATAFAQGDRPPRPVDGPTAADKPAVDRSDRQAPQTPAKPAETSDYDFETGEVILDVASRPDVGSSKFQEYRDVVKGVSLPGFRLFGREKQIRFDLRGENVKQLDERYTAYVRTDWFGLNADYNSIVHRIGNDGRTFLIQQGPGEWRMSDMLQQAIQNIWESTPNASRVFTTFVQPLFAPSINEGATVDVQVVRERTNIVADLARDQPIGLKLSYYREQRHGSGGLSSNFLNYITETPQVTEYLTQDYGISGAADEPWGNLRAAFHYNSFVDQEKSLLFDSPFRVTDALAATVGSGAAATSVGGPAFGRMINPPDNQAYYGSFGTTLKLPRSTRLTADVNLGHLTQNDQFFPYLTNSAVTTPVLAAQTSSLPVQSLNGKMGTTNLVFAVTSKPNENMHFAVRYRLYDLDNQTPRITFPGYGAWDRTWTGTPRVNVPYGYTSGRVDATVGYDVRSLTFEGGYRWNRIDRTFRETENTTENTGSIAVVWHAMDNQANLRAWYERASRGFDGLDLARSEDASFPTPPSGPSANALARDGSLRFDQSKRTTNRTGLTFDISPGSMTTLAFTYSRNADTFHETRYGLQDASYDTYTGEVSVTPSERWNVTGYYSHERNGSSQVSNGTNNFPSIDDFTIALTDKVDTLGASAVFTVLPGRATLNLSGRYQNLKGLAAFTTNPGSSYQLARASLGGVKDIPNADNAKITRLDAYVDLPLTSKVTLTLGGWYEDYVFSDVDSQGLQNIYPTAFFLALNDGSYNATVGYVKLTYHW